MSAIVEARSHLRALKPDYEPLKCALPRIARRLHISVRRLRSMWDGTATVVYAEELDAMRSARAAKAEQSLKTDTLAHALELESHAARLAQIDPDFYREEVARLRDVAGRARNAVN